MEPKRETDPELLDTLEELIQREPIFHRPELGTSRADFENMTEPTFWEVGASGRRYSREYVLDELEKRYAHPAEDVWQTRDFHCLEIAPDNYLLTYTLIQGARLAFHDGGWNTKALPDGDEVSVTCPHCNQELTGDLRELFWENFRDRGPRSS